MTSRGEVRDPVNPAMATETVPGHPAPPPRRRTGGRARFTARGVALLRSLRRYLPDESQHLFALTLLVGALCGLVAVAFHLAIRGAEGMMIERALHAGGSSWMVWTIVTPTAGGLLAGAALTWLVPGARGSGIPQVKQAFAREGGRIRFRDALGKFFIGAFQIGSGASLGREGPTVQICAGAASALARVTALPPRNMRRLLPVGVAAGIAAAFNAPIAAVTFTIEEIVGALDQTILSGVVVAAALAAVIERGILGVHPVIEVGQTYGLAHVSSLAFYALLGLAAALVSIGFTDGLLWMRARFRRTTRLPAWTHPALGGLVTGGLAVLALSLLGTEGINGGGYATLGQALGGHLGLQVLLALCAMKAVATIFSYSSGGAGGIFAPSLFVGAMLGGAIGHLDVFALGHEQQQLGAFALVGMGAVFAGVIRAPITSVLIIFEMTGGYGLVLPLMLANMTSYMIARRLRPLPIYEALLEQDGIHLPRAAPATLSSTPGLVASLAMPCEQVPAGAQLRELIDRLDRGPARAFLVQEPAGFAVLLPEHLGEFARDAALENMLIAADVARAVPSVERDVDLADLMARFTSGEAQAAVILEDDGTPIGVVTKTALATTVLELHASLGRIAPSVPTESPHGSR